MKVTHSKDEDCTIGPNGCCTVCGVDHSGPPCPDCGGRGFHRDKCPAMVGKDGVKHETKATLQAPRWCNKCHRSTPHRVYDGQISSTCIPCQERGEAERETRAQEHQRQMTFAVESAVETRAYEAKRELLKRHGLPLPKFEVKVPCTCSAWSFPHIHSDGEARMARIAFANRQPSPQREEVAQ